MTRLSIEAAQWAIFQCQRITQIKNAYGFKGSELEKYQGLQLE